MQGLNRHSNQITSVLGIPYEYDKLPRDNSFRYLILQPGVGSEPLECSLCTVPLLDISFEAISYVWGEDVKDRKITCDGRSIRITGNLHKVLQRLRLPDVPRKLWADGICINQDDVKEKGHQVAIMGQIYRSAEHVLIYLGPDEGDHAPQLCSLLDEIVEMIECVCRNLGVSETGVFPFPAPNDPLLSDSRWKSLYHLFGNEWFKRGWVVREAAFAKIGKVIWGDSEFLWEDLMRLHMWLANRAWRTFNASGIRTWSIRLHTSAYAKQHRELADALQIYDSISMPHMLRVLNFAKYLKVSDPRDRIYAFMELSNHDTEGITIIPDYDTPFLDVYHQFAMDYTTYVASPRILDYVCHPVGAVDLVVASWVPRWDVPLRSIPSKFAKKKGLFPRNDAVCTPVFIGNTAFKTRGVILDRVRYTSILMDRSTTPQILSRIWEDVKIHTNECPYEPTRMLDAFLDTLCLGCRFHGQWETWRSHRAAFARHAKLSCGPHRGKESFQEDTGSSEDEKMDLYLDNIKAAVDGFKFIVTERGYMGLAPDVSREGDLCGIIFGCLTPCILRPTAQEHFYSFLGGAHLTGKETIWRDDEVFVYVLGEKESKDWVEWGIEEQDIYLV